MSILMLEVVEPFTVKEHGQVLSWLIGQRMALSAEKAQRVIEQVGPKVRVVKGQALDHMIGAVVQGPMDFKNEVGSYVIGTGPWVVEDVMVVNQNHGVLPGRWLLLIHGQAWRWCHETKVEQRPYRCPNCKTSRCWWSKDTVLCFQCNPPSVPQWRDLWREVAELSGGITMDDPRYTSLLEAMQQCEKAFMAIDYAEFQCGMMRMRRAAQGPLSLESKR